MSEKVIIFGATEFAQVAAIYLQVDSDYEVAAFTVNQKYIKDTHLLDIPVVAFETITQTHPPGAYKMLVATGFKRVNQQRADFYGQCKALGYAFISYVNSKAITWGHVDIGENVFIFENNVIQPFVSIGDNVIIWSGNHIGHHSRIEDHCFISSHTVISGKVTIGERSFIGVNATLTDGISIGSACIIGAGTLITHNTKAEEVYPGQKTLPASVKSSQIGF